MMQLISVVALSLVDIYGNQLEGSDVYTIISVAIGFFSIMLLRRFSIKGMPSVRLKESVKQEKEEQKSRQELADLAVKMLERQKKILEEKSSGAITVEDEITKFLKDCLVPEPVEGRYSQEDRRKAHGWLQKEFKEEFKIFNKQFEK